MTKIKVGDFIVYGNMATAGQVLTLGNQQGTVARLRLRDGIVSAETWGGSRARARTIKTAIRFETAVEAWDYVRELRERFDLPVLEMDERVAAKKVNDAKDRLRDAFAVELIQKGEKE